MIDNYGEYKYEKYGEGELEKARELNERQLSMLNLVIRATKIGLWSSEISYDDSGNSSNAFNWSDEFRRMLGFKDIDDFPNTLEAWAQRLHPDEREEVLEHARRHLNDKTGRTPYNIEYRLKNKGGEYNYFRAAGETFRDEEGNALRIAGALIDISETKNILLDNELQLAKLNLTVRASKAGLWDMEVVQDDPVNENNIFTWSDEFRRMLGFEDERDFPNILSSWSDRLHPDDKPGTLEALKKHLFDKTGRTPYNIEYRLKKKNGEYAYYRASGESIRDEEGSALRIAGALLDLTEEKKILFEVERHRLEAEKANLAKSEFLRTISHEIRTPMNAILGISEILLQNNALDANTIEGLEKIYTSGDMMLGIINDVLDLSKIEAGKLELITANYETASLISDTAQLNMMRIGSKSIEFELDIDENLPAVLSGDELRVKQVLNNLLSNAFKYTDEGTVKMSVTSEKSGGKAGESGEEILIMTVSDTGKGLTREQIDRLFDEFSRFNQESHKAAEGTGLGVSITRSLVNMMNGTIDVKSEPDKGSVFTVRLPQGRVGSDIVGKEISDNLYKFKTVGRAQMKRAQITREPIRSGSVLIVDDVETNIFVAKGLLLPYELMVVDSVDSGFGAIEKIKGGWEYDIIFMDHMMPELDGVETTRIIREMGYDKPIVALTANAVSGQAEIFLKNGFDDFISKPIDIRRLNSVVNRLIRDKHLHLTETPGIAAKPADPVTLNPEFIEIIVRDVNKSLAALDSFIAKSADSDYKYTEEETRGYVVHMHGMKSALANAGKIDLSAAALKFEQYGRDGNISGIKSGTPDFLDSLRFFIEEINLQSEDNNTDIYAETEDSGYLSEMLAELKRSCEDYDEDGADEILTGLRKEKWTKRTSGLLKEIAVQLLHSDFDEISGSIDKFTGS